MSNVLTWQRSVRLAGQMAHVFAATTLGAPRQLSWISSTGRSRQTAALHVLRTWMFWQRSTLAQVSSQAYDQATAAADAKHSIAFPSDL